MHEPLGPRGAAGRPGGVGPAHPYGKATARGRCRESKEKGLLWQNRMETLASGGTLWEVLSFPQSPLASVPGTPPPPPSRAHHISGRDTWSQRGEVHKAQPLGTPASLASKPGCSDSSPNTTPVFFRGSANWWRLHRWFLRGAGLSDL